MAPYGYVILPSFSESFRTRLAYSPEGDVCGFFLIDEDELLRVIHLSRLRSLRSNNQHPADLSKYRYLLC